MSDFTPKVVSKVVGKPGAFDPIRKSKISEAELKDEIIKDLTGRKSRISGSKKAIKRHVSSQLINYTDKPRFTNSRTGMGMGMGKNTASSQFSESSANKMQEINLLHDKLHRMNSYLGKK